LTCHHPLGDVVAFVREPTSECTWHFSVNLAGDQGITLYCSVGVEHAVVAEQQRRLCDWNGTVCQVGVSMLDLVHDAEQSSPTPLRWWIASLGHVDEVVAQVVGPEHLIEQATGMTRQTSGPPRS
jgi:hypothetical protein